MQSGDEPDPADADEHVGRGLAWAGSVLGDEVVEHARLLGGATSTMLRLRTAGGHEAVLRLLTEQPWRRHGPQLAQREHDVQLALADTDVPAPLSLGVDAEGDECGVSAHLMTMLAGRVVEAPTSPAELRAMADVLGVVHAVEPPGWVRAYESWVTTDEAPTRAGDVGAWRAAIERIGAAAPAYRPVLLHRDFSHRNLLWDEGRVSGVVDWVETSVGPAWLDVAHAASNLAMTHGPDPAQRWHEECARRGWADDTEAAYWDLLDAVGFLPAPGGSPVVGGDTELARLGEWVGRCVRRLA